MAQALCTIEWLQTIIGPHVNALSTRTPLTIYGDGVRVRLSVHHRTRKDTAKHAPVDILLRTHGLSNSTFAVRAHVGAEGELDEDAAHSLVFVEFLDDIDNIGDLRLFGDLDVLELDADLFCGLRLHAHIHGRVRTRARLDNGELRLKAGILGLQRLDPARDLVADGSAGIALVNCWQGRI